MGVRNRCFLDGNQVTEPINLSDLRISLSRDKDTHGMQFEASNISLVFIADAFNYLETKYKEQGLKANVICVIDENCGDNEDSWEELINGKINFGQRKEHAGISCNVSYPIESSPCQVLLNNKLDQSVDIDKITAQDGITALPQYFNLGIDMTVPTKAIDYKTEGYVDDGGDDETSSFSDTGSSAFILVRPDFKKEISANINDSELTGTSTIGFAGSDDIFLPISPAVLYDEANPKCFGESFKVNGRLKGTVSMPNATQVYINLMLKRGEINPNLVLDPVVDVRHEYADGTVPGIDHPVNVPFDWTFAEYDWFPSNTGSEGMYLMLAILAHGDATGTIHFDEETFIKIETLKTCPPTNTKAYLVHETLSRAVESVTNYCMRVKSSYYGRRDSEPFSFDNDGCGGLRFLTSGLKLRNAANPTFFASLQDLIGGLRFIDNVGFAVEEDEERPGFFVLRIEALEYFYRNQEVLRHPYIPAIDTTIDIDGTYSTIQVGYEKWQTQANFGLDEYNSTREFSTSLSAITNILKIVSNLIAGQYPIEITREQQYVDTSEADTTYDNEIFILCMKRITAMGYPYGEMVVEQGNISDPENVFSPSSILNYSITPVRNLMRWFKVIAAGYPNITDSDNKLFFNSGEGNIIAKGELSELYGGSCRLEKDAIAENQNITAAMYINPNDAQPLWRNELPVYDYPMSLADYKKIKANPYGYISYQKGNGEWKKGWIMEADYSSSQGMGSFKLKNLWE